MPFFYIKSLIKKKKVCQKCWSYNLSAIHLWTFFFLNLPYNLVHLLFISPLLIPCVYSALFLFVPHKNVLMQTIALTILHFLHTHNKYITNCVINKTINIPGH